MVLPIGVDDLLQRAQDLFKRLLRDVEHLQWLLNRDDIRGSRLGGQQCPLTEILPAAELHDVLLGCFGVVVRPLGDADAALRDDIEVLGCVAL